MFNKLCKVGSGVSATDGLPPGVSRLTDSLFNSG